eukprot:INCI13952.1.p1 GENE.INCI13952.1~~INCI13952.1.p1  ORF type:complete len:307 (+),score=41.00 INCI13952.1:208-1128(+)
MPASHPKQSEHSDSSSENASAVSYFPQKAHIDIPDWSLMSEKKKIALFNAVLEHYREPGPLQRILPRLVIPDTTNRGNTGLSVEHVHWVASKIQEEGFMPRTGSGPNSSGHDLPIVVRESTFSDFGPESLLKWQRQLSNEPGFAPLRINEDLSAEARAQGSRKASTTTETCSENDDEDCIFFFGSLGNGHFFQALNLFAAQHPSLWKAGQRYRIRNDSRLRMAIEAGVPAVVLQPHITRRARKFLSEVLNSAFTYFWDINDRTGEARINPNAAKKSQVSQFDALSKSLDSHELGSLITHALKKSRL